MDKLSKEIFTNEHFFDTFLEEKNYIIIKKFEQFSKRTYYNYFKKRILKPKNSKIKEGIMYINQLYDFINQLINIFKYVFHCSKQAHLNIKKHLLK